jgi:hypothetical protein
MSLCRPNALLDFQTLTRVRLRRHRPYARCLCCTVNQRRRHLFRQSLPAEFCWGQEIDGGLDGRRRSFRGPAAVLAGSRGGLEKQRPTNFDRTLPALRSDLARQMIKDISTQRRSRPSGKGQKGPRREGTPGPMDGPGSRQDGLGGCGRSSVVLGRLRHARDAKPMSATGPTPCAWLQAACGNA